MKIKNTIPHKIIGGMTAILAEYIPGLTPEVLISALEQYGEQGDSKANKVLQKPFTIQETADFLGVCRPTIYQLFQKGILTRGGFGRNVRIPAEDIQDYIRGKFRPENAPQEAE